MLNLKQEMITLLKQCLTSHRPDLLWVIDRTEIIKIDEVLGNELREAVMDELLEIGLDSNDQPNKVGIQMEDLIDQIGSLFN
ncbi:hypothetical protein MUB16_36105 [Priestia sp. OVL9]|nr:hypothetical protein [Priestia sp. OVL9]MCJ7988021.1 hypothetical protein [Priestia sp. OVL9]MCJ7988055.1 hypothetical protein [Priestia sp. OVL9]